MNVTKPSDESRAGRRRILLVSGHVARHRTGWHGAATALAATTIAVSSWSLRDQHVSGTAGALVSQTAVDVLVAVAVGAVLMALLFATVGRRVALPWTYIWTFVACGFVLGTLGAGASLTGWLASALVLVVGSSLLGAAIGALLPGPKRAPLRRFDPRLIASASALALLVAPSWWLATASQERPQPVDVGTVETLPSDPAAPGEHEVSELVYGSGGDQSEPYGGSVDLATTPVDASAIVSGWDDQRESLWGFGIDQTPINGRVWYPEGDGPFPLVLIAHGNKSNATASEDGFAYLGELLASRGFVTASVDQNFLNTGPLDATGGLTGVEVARGWLLLEHLRQWQAWNDGPDSPFADQIAMDRIGLIGHSRGGEAIAVAAHLNGLDSLPDDTSVRLDHDHSITSLLALAPSDGQYLPGGEPIRLDDVDYLVLQGSHDADVASFGGLNQYERVGLDREGPQMKAAVYIGGGNHSGFNSRWGDRDIGNGLPKHFIDQGALLPAQEQQRIARAYASAFMRASLAGDPTDAALLRDHRAGAPYLPQTDYVNQFASADTDYVGQADTTGFDAVDTVDLDLRSGPGEDRVRSLSRSDGEASVIIEAPERATSALVFDALDIGEESDSAVTVRLVDASGTTAERPLAEISPLRKPIEGRYLKAAWMHSDPLTEPVLQTHTVPLGEVVADRPEFELAGLRTVELVVDGRSAGTILLDDIGFVPEHR